MKRATPPQASEGALIGGAEVTRKETPSLGFVVAIFFFRRAALSVCGRDSIAAKAGLDGRDPTTTEREGFLPLRDLVEDAADFDNRWRHRRSVT
ncbi:hypothetical protein MTO96_014110 [Rhipicephalus appendiculatus]